MLFLADLPAPVEDRRMLETFRNAAKSWVAKLLLGLLVVSFAAWGITDVFRGGGVQDLATVGNQSISGSDYTQAVNRAIQRYSSESGTRITYEDAKRLGLDRQVRDSLIAGASIDEKARGLRIMVSPANIAQDAANNPAFRNAEGKFDRATFQRVLEANGLTEAGFLASEQQNRQRTILTSSAAMHIVPKVMADAERQFRDETRTASYFTFTVDTTTAPQPTADEIKKQYEATPQAYTAPEYRAVAVLHAFPEDTASRFEVSDPELTSAFDRMKGDYAVPERRSFLQLGFKNVSDAEKALTRIKAGEDFTKIATELGFKPTDITFDDKVRGDIIDPKVADAVFSAKLNDVGSPVQGSLTTALIKTTAITPGKEPTLTEHRDDIMKRVQTEKAAEDIQSIFDTVEELRSNDKKFEEIAAQLNIPVTIIPAIAADGTGKDGKTVALPASDQVLKSIFETEVGVENDALDANGGYVWYEVRETIPSALKPLKDVEAQVRSDWQVTKLRDVAAEKAKAIVAKAKAGTSLIDLAKEAGATVKTVPNLKRGQALPEFDGLAAISLFGIPEKGFAWSLEGDGKSARIIQAEKVELPAASAPATDANKEMRFALSRDMEETFLKAARNAVPVTINEELWARVSGASQ
jgi:peptidyl-prolyl cis-trans isomerase D